MTYSLLFLHTHTCVCVHSLPSLFSIACIYKCLIVTNWNYITDQGAHPCFSLSGQPLTTARILDHAYSFANYFSLCFSNFSPVVKQAVGKMSGLQMLSSVPWKLQNVSTKPWVREVSPVAGNPEPLPAHLIINYNKCLLPHKGLQLAFKQHQ